MANEMTARERNDESGPSFPCSVPDPDAMNRFKRGMRDAGGRIGKLRREGGVM